MQAPIPMFIGLFMFSFLISLPCGYIRQNFSKYTFMWFLWIHLPIPFIIFSRTQIGLDWHVVPLTLFGAVLGQIIGGRMNQKRNSVEKAR